MNVGGKMKAAIDQLPYQAALKVGLQMKRRFWEQDDRIYGGITYTNQPNSSIGYPMWDYFSKGKGVLLGAYTFGEAAFVAAAKSPEDRVKDALEYGEKIHPGKYKKEFDCGVAVAWHRVPWTLGCAGKWTAEGREAHYNTLRQRMGASCWRASMPRACRPGRGRGHICHRRDNAAGISA